MNLSDLYKVKQIITEKVSFNDCDFEVLLMTSEEIDSIASLEIHEQLSKCIIENGKTLFESGQADNLKKNMPIAHQKKLMDILMRANGIGVSYEEVKKN